MKNRKKMVCLKKFRGNRIRSIFIFVFAFMCLVNHSHCIFDNDSDNGRGEIISSEFINSYSLSDINQLWSLFGLEFPIGLRFSVEAYSIVYWTIDSSGEAVQASGAFVLPVSDQGLPFLSLQHGTESKRNLVASVSPMNSIEGIAGLYMASVGYLVCIPDYLGFGVSNMIHPYCHASANTAVIVDFLRAAKKYCDDQGIPYEDRLFLTGYSEGGYTTLAAQKDIENNYGDEFAIAAVAPMAGPYDLSGTIKKVFQKKSYPEMGFMGFLFTAYNNIYEWNRLNDVFKSPYGDMMTDLFSGSYTWGEITSQLPDTFSGLIKSSFVTNYLNGTETEIIAAYGENTLLNWAPQAPLRFFHGDADQVVPYQNAVVAVSNLRNSGGVNISLVTIKGGNHETSVAPCFIAMILWFDQLN